jgi:cell division protease FtsH
VTYERPRQPLFAPESFSQNKAYSETMAARIDEEVARLIEEAHKRVQVILTERRKVLDDLARLLSKEEIVQGDELRKMLSSFMAEGSSETPAEPSREDRSPTPGSV